MMLDTRRHETQNRIDPWLLRVPTGVNGKVLIMRRLPLFSFAIFAGVQPLFGQAPDEQLGEPLPGTAPAPGIYLPPGLGQNLPDPAASQQPPG